MKTPGVCETPGVLDQKSALVSIHVWRGGGQ
jgi:hypothetical protein